jgi:hypothetical protein
MKKNIKSLIVTSLLAGLIALSPVTALADAHLEINDVTLEIDGVRLEVESVLFNSRTLLPIRSIVEILGGEVEWNEELRQVILTHGNTVISLTIDSTLPTVNGEEIEIDVPAQIINGRTFLPLRFIAESLGFIIDLSHGIIHFSTIEGLPLIQSQEQATIVTPVLETPVEEMQLVADIHTLFSGTFIVGQDIPAGRYVITGDDSGNFIIRNNDNRLVVNEILNVTGGSNAHGVPSVTVDINDGYEIEIRGISNVFFTPAINQHSTVLTTGIWVVGVHIPVGQFDARPTVAGDSGNFVIHHANGRLAVNEILRDRVRVSLQEGQVIQIRSLTSVTFE